METDLAVIPRIHGHKMSRAHRMATEKWAP